MKSCGCSGDNASIAIRVSGDPSFASRVGATRHITSHDLLALVDTHWPNGMPFPPRMPWVAAAMTREQLVAAVESRQVLASVQNALADLAAEGEGTGPMPSVEKGVIGGGLILLGVLLSFCMWLCWEKAEALCAALPGHCYLKGSQMGLISCDALTCSPTSFSCYCDGQGDVPFGGRGGLPIPDDL